MPSPWPEHPGLFIRDTYHYSDAMLVIPPLLTRCLGCFDGEQTELDLRAMLVRLTNTLEVGEIVRQLVDTLSAAGFLEDHACVAVRDPAHGWCAKTPVREPAHPGSASPAEPGQLRETLANYMQWGGPPGLPSSGPPAAANLFATPAPHVTPHGGCRR